MKSLRPPQPPWSALEGEPVPQGVAWLEEECAYNFALYSKHAGAVTLLLYHPGDLVRPQLAHRLDHYRHKTGRVWHCRLPEAVVGGARYYGYQVDAPPEEGERGWNRFDPDKILLDPYARDVFFPPDFDRAAAIGPGSNAGRAPLGVIPPPVPSSAFDWQGDRRPSRNGDRIIYELHVRGFTRSQSSGVDPERRGTYLGVIDRIPYLKDLGVTAVELMPVFQRDPQEDDYWGYMPLSFFAPHEGYASSTAPTAAHDEFRQMVRALHAADIEVILDVVYNHTAEGDHRGPTYSQRGIDNSTYYMMTGDPHRPYANHSGTGNTLHTANYYVRKMILDSLRYWVEEMRVDGFRFDLASVFTRTDDGSVDLANPGLFAEIASDPVLSRVHLIAEPWDASGANHLGRALPGISWSQWNARFRDDVRRFVRGDAGFVYGLMRRVYGSDDLFPDDRIHAYRPYQSINYVTCHDGFTLYDLVSYSTKRNWPNGEENRDGADENFSWNSGWEGDDGVPREVLDLRKRQAKFLVTLLLISNGVPMIRSGDEFLQTQGGNNNPFNQDNATSWLDWSKLRENADFFRFFKLMVGFRKAHPSIARSRFWRDDVTWYSYDGKAHTEGDGHSVAYRLAGGAQDDVDLYFMVNGGAEERSFVVPPADEGDWRLAIDSAAESPDDIREPGQELAVSPGARPVRGRSVQVLVADAVSPTTGWLPRSQSTAVRTPGGGGGMM